MSFNFKKILKYNLYTIIVLIILISIINFYVLSFSKWKIYNSSNDIKNYEIGLVLWASVKSSWEPSDILKDRLKMVIKAYNDWKIQSVIVSGYNYGLTYNEPLSMEQYLIKAWVSSEDIYKDYEGIDTYDSIYRAREIFWTQKLVIFTQEFHLKRALYIASRLWIDAVWVQTDLQKYLSIRYFEFREIFSRIKAFIEVDVMRVEIKYDKNEKVQIK